MIKVENLEFTYPGSSAPAIRAIDFDVAAGEVFGFLGPSGSGKSTTQNILIGLLRGWRGAVSVLGRTLGAWDAEYYGNIGVSFEVPTHYSKLTARENLELFRALHGGDADPAELWMERVGLLDALDVRVSEFSKGMKQRLTVARSLLHRPTLWFLDEPTSGLDPVNARRIMEIVEERVAAGVTAFLTTHDMTVADRLCDRVGFIVDGQIRVVDAPSALRRQYGTREVVVTWDDDGGGSARFPLDDLGRNPGFRDILHDHHIETLHSQETTLEDVFVQVTGRALL